MTLIKTGYDPSRALTVSQTSAGVVYFVNGVDKPQKYGSSDSVAIDAGMPAGISEGMTVAGSGSGAAVAGSYSTAIRYIDADGVPGDLSPTVQFFVDPNSPAAQVDYAAIPLVPPEHGRVVSRQLWRTTADQVSVFYLDSVIDLIDTAYTSTKTDAELLSSEALPVLNIDGTPNARRFGIPPDWKAVVVSHQERTFWGVNAVIDAGHARVTTGSASVTIIGAYVSLGVIGRLFVVPGDDTPYEIIAVAENAEGYLVTLDRNFSGTTSSFSDYEIRMPQEEANRVYFSELAESEAVPLTNAVDVVANEGDNGAITSMMSMGSFIWIMTPNRIYRWTYQVHPSFDGAIYLTANRGCLNQRCWTLVDGNAYVMDREGFYMFNGGNVINISGHIQDMFRPGGGIVWDNAKWFHCEQYYLEETVKFFVCLDGSDYPRHAMCYNFRKGTWWIEDSPWATASSSVISRLASSRLIVGSTQGRIMLTSEGEADGVVAPVPERALATSGGLDSVTVPGIPAPDDLLLAPIHITSGRGVGQERLIYGSDADGTLFVDAEWDTIPDDTSEIQIGGIRWEFATKEFRLTDEDTEQSRKIALSFAPVKNSATIDMSIVKDKSKRPADYGIDYDRLDGLSVGRDSSLVHADISENEYGWLFWAFDAQHDYRGPATRYISVWLGGVSNNENISIHRLVIEGVK